MNTNLANQPARTQPKPSHNRKSPKRGNLTKFSKKVRQQIVERDHGLCVRCKRQYHSIHHIQFASSGGAGVVSNGCCVCEPCHSAAHRSRTVREWFERYKTKLEVAK